MSKRILVIALGGLAVCIAVVVLWPDAPPVLETEPVSTPPVATVEVSEPSPTLGPAVVKEAIVGGERHRFVERHYDPPYLLKRFEQAPPTESLKTEEDAMGGYTSAMSKVDWDWWYAMWDRKGQQTIGGVIQGTTGRSGTGTYKDNMLAGWNAYFSDRRYELVSRIDIPGYQLMYFRRQGQSDTSRDLLTPVVMKKEGDRWVMTHDLQEHIVANLKITDKDVDVRTVQ